MKNIYLLTEQKIYWVLLLKYREDPIFLDPRNKKLGARLIINLEKLYLSLKKLDLKDDKIENYYIKVINLE